MIDHTNSKCKETFHPAWFWGGGFLTLLFLFEAMAIPFVQNYRAIHRVKSLHGANITVKPGFLLGALPVNTQSWLHDTLGSDRLLPFETVTIVWFSSPTIKDNDIICLSGIPQLEWLHLSFSQVSDDGLVHLKELTKLKRLILDHSNVSDTGLIHLKGLTNLTELRLSGPQVTAEGVERLRAVLPNCEITYTIVPITKK